MTENYKRELEMNPNQTMRIKIMDTPNTVHPNG